MSSARLAPPGAGPAVIVEPPLDPCRSDAVQELRPEGWQNPSREQQPGALLRGRLVAVEMRLLPASLDEVPEARRRRLRRGGQRVVSSAARCAWQSLADLVDALQGRRAERDAPRPAGGLPQQDVALASRGPDPHPETCHASVPNGILPLAGPQPRDGGVGEPHAFLPGHGYFPSTAPTVSDASSAAASAGCVYLRVVPGSAWPSSLPIARTVSPHLKAWLAYVCRRS